MYTYAIINNDEYIVKIQFYGLTYIYIYIYNILYY